MRLLPKPVAMIAIGAIGLTSGGFAGWALWGRTAPDNDVALRTPAAAVVTVAEETGIETTLGTDPQGTVSIASAEGHDVALLRLAALPSPAELTVFAVGAPALVLDADESGSTTVLVPVDSGQVHLSASTPTSVRVEPLAFFDADPNTPGSTVPLATPVTRADTTAGIGGPALGSEPIQVSVTGSGGVPSTGVRAVYATAVVDVPQATRLVLGAQQYDLPVGTTAVTTIVPPSPDGRIAASLTSGTGSLRLDVRGWVPEAQADQSGINVTGSLVPTLDPVPLDVTLTTRESGALTTATTSDTRYALAVVSAEASESTRLTLAAEGARAGGIVLDPTVGATPQLAVVAADGASPGARVDQGTTTAQVLPVGSILGDPAPSKTSAAPIVAISSPAPHAKVDLANGGAVQLSGTIRTPGASVDTVRVKVGNRTVAAATVQPEGDHWRWTASTSAPTSGDYEFDVTATTRDGQTHTAQVPLTVTVPTPDQVVVAPDVAVTDEASPSITAVTATSITYAADPDLAPGAVVVAPPSDEAPEGLLRRVDTVDRTPDGWVVATADAQITDVLLQADETIDTLADGAQATIEPVIEAVDEAEAVEPAEAVDQVEAVDDGVAPVDIVDALPAGIDAPLVPAEPAPAAANVPAGPAPRVIGDGGKLLTPTWGIRKGDGKGVDMAPYLGIGIDTMVTWTPDGGIKDLSRANATTRQRVLDTIGASKGVALQINSYTEASMRLVLRIGLQWRWGFVPVPTVQEYSAVVGTQMQAEVTTDASAGGSWDVRFPVANIALPTTTFMIGPVPLVISVGLDVDLASTLDVHGTGHTEASTYLSGTYGWSYTSARGWQKVVEDPILGYGPPTATADSAVTLEGTAEAKAGPVLTFTIWLYETAGGQIEISGAPGMRIRHEQKTDPLTIQIFTDLGGRLSVALKIPILGIKVLDWSIVDTAVRFTIASWSIPAPDGNPPADG